MPEALSDLFESLEPERVLSGLSFTEGPTWHQDGYFLFVDIPAKRLHKFTLGGELQTVRENTGSGNGTTFDLNGNVIMCEGGNRHVSRMYPDGRIEVIAERHEGLRLNRPNDVICRSDGTLYFSNLGTTLPLTEREMPFFGVYRVMTDGTVNLVAYCEAPNGLAFSPDERTLYVSNTRWTQYIHAFDLDDAGNVTGRRIFADMSSSESDGVPDGMKVDQAGRVYCSGAGGLWVFGPDGALIGLLCLPEIPANLAFGGDDLKTLFITARTSVYTLRTTTPGIAHPLFARP